MPLGCYILLSVALFALLQCLLHDTAGDDAFPTLFQKISPELDVHAAGEEAAIHFTEVALAAGNA
jgi:hypothetical protein